jgi:hypothetical protein
MTSPVVLGDGQVRLGEVYLSGATGQGPAVVGGLALLADQHGLTVLGPEASSVRTMPWGRASTIACHRAAQLPDGRPAVMLEVDIGGNTLRFFVPQAYLGPDGAGELEQRLTALSRIPVASSPAVIEGYGTNMNGSAQSGHSFSSTAAPGVAPRVASGGPPPGVASASLPPGFASGGPAPGSLPPGSLPPGALPPATGGTLPMSQGPTAGQYVQTGKRRSRRKLRIAAVLVVILVAGGAGAYVVRSHNQASTGSGPESQDALAAAHANLQQAEVPGWTAVPGTVAGALGAFAFSPDDGATPGLAGGSDVAARAAADFGRCTKLPDSEADSALVALGFSQGIGAASGETALSSSPLFEDPSVLSTSAESSVVMFGSPGERALTASVFARRSFAGCYSLFLTAAVPSLVGGVTSKIPFAYASVHAVGVRSTIAGVTVRGFAETIYRKGRPAHTALSGTIDVVAGGRIVAVLQTISSRSFPLAEGTKLLAAVEHNVAGESS